MCYPCCSPWSGSHQRREKWKIKPGEVLLQAANLGTSSSNCLCLSPSHPSTVPTCSSSAVFHPGKSFQVTKLRNFPFPLKREENHLTDNGLDCSESQGMRNIVHQQREQPRLLCPGDISRDKLVLLGRKKPKLRQLCV